MRHERLILLGAAIFAAGVLVGILIPTWILIVGVLVVAGSAFLIGRSRRAV